MTVNFAILGSEEMVGTYANFLSVWHTPYEFTLDFAQIQPAQMTEDQSSLDVPCQLVARVKVPPSAIFDIIKALNENMTGYEANFGEIKPPIPEANMYPPDDLRPEGHEEEPE